MGTIPGDKVTREQLSADEANRLRDIGYHPDLTRGETINGATVPVPAYLKTSDGKLYACDGNDQAKLEFLGFVLDSGIADAAAQIQMSGIVPGFSGLSKGSRYYVQDAVGTIGTSLGTYECYVGIAVSTTEILIDKGPRAQLQYMGSQVLASGGNTIPAALQSEWRMIIVSLTSGASSGDVVLTRYKTGGTTTGPDGSAPSFQQGSSVSWSGTTITLSNSGNPNTPVATAFYYR